jgi:hypothetical protein
MTGLLKPSQQQYRQKTAHVQTICGRIKARVDARGLLSSHADSPASSVV